VREIAAGPEKIKPGAAGMEAAGDRQLQFRHLRVHSLV
jgi:hypothetical protein